MSHCFFPLSFSFILNNSLNVFHQNRGRDGEGDTLTMRSIVHLFLPIPFVCTILQVPLPTLPPNVCPGSERGSGTAVGHTRGDTTPQPERSSATTPASVTVAGSRVTPSQPDPVDLHRPARATTLLCSNR